LFFKQDSGSAHSLFGNVPVIVLSLGFLWNHFLVSVSVRSQNQLKL
jgi:hypothetical protein